VFTREDGSPIPPDHFSKQFRRHASAAELRPFRLHDLRHTHASLLLASGVNPKVASERLGHHSVAFTLDVSSHVVPGMQSAATERVAELIFDEDPSSHPENGLNDGRPDDV
jgi:integrase